MRKKILLAILATVLFCGSAFAATATYLVPTSPGTIINGTIGQADKLSDRVVVLGDFTGDQFPDFAFSGGYSNLDKHIYIYKGSINPIATTVEIADFWNGKNPNIIAITEINPDIQCGRFIAGGKDFDGDKINDMAFTCYDMITRKITYYLVYGAKNFPSIIKTTDLGVSVRATKFTFDIPTDTIFDEYVGFGDIDGDNKSELVLGYGKDRQLYIVKGGTTFPNNQIVTLSETYLNGQNGFVVKLGQLNNYYNRFSITLVDLNGDNRKDIVLGQLNFINEQTKNTFLYIVFGKATMPAKIDVSNTTVNGINIAKINSLPPINPLDLANIGDINVDGMEDLAIANNYDYSSPKINIIFGKLSWSATGDTVNFDGKDGSIIDGLGFIYAINLNQDSGRETFAVSAGDFNSDGIKDVIFGSQRNKQWGSVLVNRAVIVMGQRFWPARLTLNTTTINGIKAVEFKGPDSFATSVNYIENIYGGVGCGLDSSYLFGSPYSKGYSGQLFISNFKK